MNRFNDKHNPYNARDAHLCRTCVWAFSDEDLWAVDREIAAGRRIWSDRLSSPTLNHPPRFFASSTDESQPFDNRSSAVANGCYCKFNRYERNLWMHHSTTRINQKHFFITNYERKWSVHEIETLQTDKRLVGKSRQWIVIEYKRLQVSQSRKYCTIEWVKSVVTEIAEKIMISCLALYT